MIATTATRRSLMDRLFLDGIEHTDQRPGLMLACLGAALVLGCCLDGWLP